MHFDDNGDPPALYEIVNWQRDGNGGIVVKTVGIYDTKFPPKQQLDVHLESISWNGDHGTLVWQIVSFLQFYSKAFFVYFS